LPEDYLNKNILKNKEVSLLIFDIRMPVMTGFGFKKW
jgi:YesN/AraC family two-component response regulator